jgi:hypothetical protein
VRRFAGLQAARSDAMKRAKTRAEEMLLSGELQEKAKSAQVAVKAQDLGKPRVKPAAAAAATVAKPAAAAVAAASKPVPAPGSKGIKFAQTIERRESISLNQEEEDMLNRAILTMFLEDQAPDKVGKAEDLLEKFQGNVDALFDNLSSGNGDIESLMQSEDTNTPAWDRFAAMRKQRMSAKGFFGTGSASPLAYVAEDSKVLQRSSFASPGGGRKGSMGKKRESGTAGDGKNNALSLLKNAGSALFTKKA